MIEKNDKKIDFFVQETDKKTDVISKSSKSRSSEEMSYSSFTERTTLSN